MSDNELDNLFKEAAADFESPQDATAWKQMSAKLDQHTPQPAGFWSWKRIGSFTVAGLLIGAVIYYAVSPTTNLNSIEKNTTVANAVQNSTPKADDENIPTLSSISEESIVEPNEPNLGKTKGGDVQNSKLNSKQRISTPKAFNRHADLETIREDDLMNPPSATAEVYGAGTHEQQAMDLKSSSLTDTEIDVLKQASKASTVDELIAPIPDSVVNPITRFDSLVNAEKTVNKKDKVTKGGSGFVLKLAVSPDYSAINFSSFDKSGINYGALVGYALNKRWSVFTGVISAKKLYSTTEVESSYASGGNTYPIEKLDGDCRILDIPVNVYYNFFPERSLSLKAGVGFSSYIMLNETYVYCVDYYGTDTYYEQQIKRENNEWFKVLNLSIIAEKKLSTRFSAEVEPFVKVPLAGIGEGKISLGSLGAFVNVKYNLFKNP